LLKANLLVALVPAAQVQVLVALLLVQLLA